jgi:hypothetical protein
MDIGGTMTIDQLIGYLIAIENNYGKDVKIKYNTGKDYYIIWDATYLEDQISPEELEKYVLLA